MGQNAKYSLRADVFCFVSNNGHRSTRSACPFGARLRHRRLAYSPGSRSGVGEIIAARRRKEKVSGEQADALKHIELLVGIHA